MYNINSKGDRIQPCLTPVFEFKDFGHGKLTSKSCFYVTVRFAKSSFDIVMHAIIKKKTEKLISIYRVKCFAKIDKDTVDIFFFLIYLWILVFYL